MIVRRTTRLSKVVAFMPSGSKDLLLHRRVVCRAELFVRIETCPPT